MKIILACILSLYCISTLAAEEKKSEEEASGLGFKISAGYFYDGNVSQSVNFSSNGLPTGPGGKVLPNRLSRPTSTVYTDGGYLANLDYEHEFFSTEKNQFGVLASADSTTYLKYTTYDSQSLKAGFSWGYTGDGGSFNSSLAFSTAYSENIPGQEYLKLSTSYSLKESALSSIGLDATKYMNNHVNEYNVSAPINFSWIGDMTTKTLGVTFGYGSGDPAKYARIPGSAPYVDSGDEFSRYTQASLSLGISRKWSDRMKTSFDLTGSNTNYSEERIGYALPVGVKSGARVDTSVTATLDVKYQIKPDRLSCEFSSSLTRANSSGYQGMPSGTSGPPSYTYDRPYMSLSLIYEM